MSKETHTDVQPTDLLIPEADREKDWGWTLPGNGGWLYVYPGDRFLYHGIGISGLNDSKEYRSKLLQEPSTGNCLFGPRFAFGANNGADDVWLGSAANIALGPGHGLDLQFDVPSHANPGDVTKLKLRARKNWLVNATYHQADLAVQVLAPPAAPTVATMAYDVCAGQSLQKQYAVPDLAPTCLYQVAIDHQTPLAGNLTLTALNATGIGSDGLPAADMTSTHNILELSFVAPMTAQPGDKARVVVKLDKGDQQSWPTLATKYVIFEVVVVAADKVNMLVSAKCGTTKDQLTTTFSSGAIFRSPTGTDPHGLAATTTKKVYDGTVPVVGMIAYLNGIITAFDQSGIYYSPDGNFLGDITSPGSLTKKVYTDPFNPWKLMTAYGDGVLSAWQFGGIYYSPDGENLGGGGNTHRVYPTTPDVPAGTPCVVDMIPYRGPTGLVPDGVLIAFDDGYVYYSEGGQSLHGELGQAPSYYSVQPQNPQNIVAKMIPFGTGVLTAFRWGGIYFSGDGMNLAGGGDPATHRRVYPESTHASKKMIAMVSYQQGVITAFSNREIYYSMDGLHLGDQMGATQRVYAGPHTLKAIMCCNFGNGLEVVTAFDDGCIYRSKNGLNLGVEAGQTVRIYP